MTLRKAALLCGFFDGDIAVVKFLHIVQCIFQPAVGQLQVAVVDGGGGAVLVHLVQEEEEIGFDHQFMGGVALFPVFEHGQDAGCHGLVEVGACRIKALHGPLAIQKGKDIFVVAGILLGSPKEGGVKQDVEVFSAL